MKGLSLVITSFVEGLDGSFHRIQRIAELLAIGARYHPSFSEAAFAQVLRALL